MLVRIFAGLVNRYSQDVESTGQGGFIPPVDWNMSLSSNLNQTVFHLAVNGGRVVESSASIRIVKVAQVNMRDVPPYEDVKDGIRYGRSSRCAEFNLHQFERTKDNLDVEKTAQWNSEAIK